MKAVGYRLGVFAQNPSALFDDLYDARIAAGRRLEDHRSEHGDFHLVRCLHPANQFIEVVQRERMQDFRSEIHLGAMQIVFVQDQTESLDGKKIAATGISQDMSPSACSLNPFAAPSSYRRTTPRVYDNAVAVIQCRRQARIAVAACHDFGIWPKFETDLPEHSPVFLCPAASQENACAIDLLRKLCKNCV